MLTQNEQLNNSIAIRLGIGLFGVAILAGVYVFQHVSFFSILKLSALGSSNYTAFIFNKTVRMILNDVACMLLIKAIFYQRKYVMAAFYVFLFELLILLPLYFILKLTIEGDSE